VVLGGELLGGPECPWPQPQERACAAAELPTLRRRAARVELARPGACRVCSGPTGRASVGLRANATGRTKIRKLEVKRGAD